MIEFLLVGMQNFLSYGNAPTVFQLNDTKATLIFGSNGTGKSSVIDGICFALFGSAFRKVNKGSVVNTINAKRCLVFCEFRKGTNHFRVERGIKPNVFNIYKDGELIEQTAASKDYQKILEEDILALNYKTFTQISILSSASFVPFLQLPAGDRRNVVEDLLDIKIFSGMAQLAKSKLNSVVQDINAITFEIDNIKGRIDTLNRFIVNLKQQEKTKDAEIDVKIAEAQVEIDEYTIKAREFQEQKTVLYATITDAPEVSTKKEQIVNAVRKLENAKNGFCTEHKFLTNNDSCPTCNQDIDAVFKSEKIALLSSNIDKRDAALASAKATIQGYIDRQAEITAVLDQLKVLDGKITTCNYESDMRRRDIKGFMDTKEKVLVSYDQEERDVIALGEKLAEKDAQKDVLVENRGYWDVINLLLKDTGVKSSIIRQYTPILNHFINHYLEIMEFFVKFTFDENFNDTIQVRHRDTLTYYSLSEGQKKRVDLAILFAFRAISEAKNVCNTNILFLDEILDSALDAEGIEAAISILDSFSGKNIFVISPRPPAIDFFSREIKVSSVNNYSSIDIIDN
jgi:DNA repair exonuclease SbcCD ATPase subunit